MNKLMHTIDGVVYAGTSTFWSQAGLNLFTNLLPFWPRQIHRHPLLSGLSTFTGLSIWSCIGCPPSWLSGCVEWESQLFRGVMRARCYPLLQLPGGRVMVPEMKCELDWYKYVLVQTKYVLFTQSMYLVHTIFTEYVLGTYWYVLCSQKYCRGIWGDAVLCCMPVGNNTMCVWHVCSGALILICAPIGVQHTWH